jgi:hypothetical protein
MNTKILAAVLLLTAPLSAQADSDAKMISPGLCQPYGQTSTYDTLAIRADGIQNKTTNTNKYFICGIGRDGESAWDPEGEGGQSMLLYFVYEGNGSIQCTRTIGTDLGDYNVVPGPVSDTVNAVRAVPYNLWVATFPEAAGDSFQTATVTCRIPPQAKFSFAQVYEGVGTDTIDP